VLGVPTHHYLAYQLDYTELERLYLHERVEKRGALAPLTVREALGVCTATTQTVRPIDFLDLDDPDLQPLRRCAAASGAAFHSQCITAWHAQLAKEGKALTCPVCRHAWMDALTAGVREQEDVSYATVTHPLGAAIHNAAIFKKPNI
jgi:hypothetical protein